MNLFYLHADPQQAARMHCDAHVVKMILETAQMLCTAHHVHGTAKPCMYKATHTNHPSTQWVAEAGAHYQWAWRLMFHLTREHMWRYNHRIPHKSYRVLRDVLPLAPTPVIDRPWIRDPPQCMPSTYKGDDTVEAYRRYYATDKRPLLRYTRREKPEWL